MATEQYVVNYPAGVSSLKDLERTCEVEQVNRLANIKSLGLGTSAGTNITIGVFEGASSVRFGRLTFVELKTDVDEHGLKAVHQSKGGTFLFKGAAYIQNNPVTLLAFGAHGPGDRP